MVIIDGYFGCRKAREMEMLKIGGRVESTCN